MAAVTHRIGGNTKNMKRDALTSPANSANLRRPWEPMRLFRIGRFDEILRGSTGTIGDGGPSNKRRHV